ncbi:MULTISPECIES: 2-amino-4-hydroxy-6-hydroxymethyldihydropteridine diphosphokinase [Brevibacterium]|uniref:Bifunctional folate synthesis protein n=1 Tax=Brevibacterium antiquum CNRZ 918 TaxID=1255637 RepID=A0A2H1J007_9MICO|nr:MULTISPECIES: 2-amino-4-hydroxy-6-hydroxymethyldihydropteridine diphosphokinase [Brevibacterium]SMX80766.1 dihydroneopterin aldolase / 2-amino-4-hydroxy-6-hydroxymethyldihydropteridine diphosphokinase [Brevibacterium antiquum CNRZ 918]HCG55252.1 2-amino-4-hydroxy-6-hydroxymethyldihydropteridine diphosphokinase [Brevibacterium sp.]
MSAHRDRIELRGLRVRGNHGVFDFEKREGQDFVIDVTLHTSVTRAAATDDIADTVHYGELAEDVAHIVEDNTFDLIETLASRIAEHCLDLAEHVEVVVHKPGAPIQRSFNDVSVTVVRSRDSTVIAETETEAYLNLGANLGDAADTLDQAVAALDRHPRITVLRRSSLYRTAPWGGVEQGDFLNLGLIVSTSLPAPELLAVAQGIEVSCGRTRELRWGPRTLDIDLIRFGTNHEELVFDTEALTLPHPRAHERAFVLAPWVELDGGAEILTPTGPRPITAVLTELGDQEITRIQAP